MAALGAALPRQGRPEAGGAAHSPAFTEGSAAYTRTARCAGRRATKALRGLGRAATARRAGWACARATVSCAAGAARAAMLLCRLLGVGKGRVRGGGAAGAALGARSALMAPAQTPCRVEGSQPPARSPQACNWIQEVQPSAAAPPPPSPPRRARRALSPRRLGAAPLAPSPRIHHAGPGGQRPARLSGRPGPGCQRCRAAAGLCHHPVGGGRRADGRGAFVAPRSQAWQQRPALPAAARSAAAAVPAAALLARLLRQGFGPVVAAQGAAAGGRTARAARAPRQRVLRAAHG